MALNGIQIFKLTPKKNCKECGCPTCMAFSMKVAQGAMKIEQCPHMSDEALAIIKSVGKNEFLEEIVLNLIHRNK